MNEQQIILLPTANTTSSLKEESGFEICSYYRECSNAMKCIQPAGVECHLCKYARKLKEGICFYGKNSIYFDHSRYEAFCKTIASLPEEEKKDFDNFAIKLQFNKKFFQQLVKFSNLYPHLEALGLMETSKAARRLLNNLNFYKIADLRKILAEQFTEEELLVNNIKFNDKKAKIINFIMENCPKIVEELNSKYVYITLPREYIDCYVEYYYDYLTDTKM